MNDFDDLEDIAEQTTIKTNDGSKDRKDRNYPRRPYSNGGTLKSRISAAQNTYHTKKRKYNETHGDKQAKLRPPDYDKLTPQEQWDIDKRLGILDME